MLASDAAREGGIGYVVPVGGFEITGVFVVVLFLLQAVNKRPHKRNVFTQRREGAKTQKRSSFFFASLRLCVKSLI
jgi:hypothetical protein